MNARIRLTSPTAVATMADANHVPYERRSHFASVQLAGVVYFWAAA